MNRIPRSAHLVLALCTALASSTAVAQAQKWRLNCMSHGSAAPEPIGDRPGHALQVSQATCSVAGGPLDGGVTTQHTAWEVDGATWRLVVSTSLQRRADSKLFGLNTVGTLNMQMQDGRPAGWTAEGKGTVAFASGAAAAFAGKAFTWTARATGPATHYVDVTVD